MSGTGEPSLPSRYSGTRVAYRGSIYCCDNTGRLRYTTPATSTKTLASVRLRASGTASPHYPEAARSLLSRTPPHKLEGAERSRKGLIDYIFVSHSKQGTLALGPKVEVGVSDVACGARRDGPLAVLVRSWYPGNGYVYDTMCHTVF